MTDAPTCPRVSPESAMPCTLADTREAHYKGHTGPHPSGLDGWTVAWPTTAADHDRWKDTDQ